jgi:hypothetical protein
MILKSTCDTGGRVVIVGKAKISYTPKGAISGVSGSTGGGIQLVVPSGDEGW